MQHVDDYHHTSAVRLPKFRDVIADLRALAPAGRTILDVGAATGDFVLTARDAGLQAEGVEQSAAAVEAALQRGVRLTCGELGDVTARYDFVHLNHVFEHFTDPVSALALIRKAMASDAILYLEIPYQFNLVERLRARVSASRFKCSVHSFHHPYMYTPRSIRRLLRGRGFEILRLRLFDLRRYPASGPTAALNKAAWRLLSAFGVGNYIEIFARATVEADDPGLQRT